MHVIKQTKDKTNLVQTHDQVDKAMRLTSTSSCSFPSVIIHAISKILSFSRSKPVTKKDCQMNLKHG